MQSMDSEDIWYIHSPVSAFIHKYANLFLAIYSVLLALILFIFNKPAFGTQSSSWAYGVLFIFLFFMSVLVYSRSKAHYEHEQSSGRNKYVQNNYAALNAFIWTTGIFLALSVMFFIK